MARHLRVCKEKDQAIVPNDQEEEDQMNPKKRQCGICQRYITKAHYRRHFRLCSMKEKQKAHIQMEFEIG